MHLADAVAWFLESWSCEGPKHPTQDTVRTYGMQLQWFVQFAVSRGKTDVVEALSPEVVRQALREKLAPRHPSTTFKGGESAATSLAAATRKMARWLLAQGVPVADLKEIHPPRPPERIQPRLRPEEFKALEQATLHQLIDGNHRSARYAVARDLALIYLLADTGLRCHEIVGMQVEDIDFERGTVYVRGKGRKPRVLSVVDASAPDSGRTLKLLFDWIVARDELPRTDAHRMLWTSLRGRQLTRAAVRTILRTLCEAAGLDGNRPPHAFRRGSFTESYKSDPRSVDLLSARMGWSKKSHHMVATYTRGAELEFAAEQPIPSLASQWHSRSGQSPPMIGKRATAGAPAANEAPRSAALGRRTSFEGADRIHNTAESRDVEPFDAGHPPYGAYRHKGFTPRSRM